MSEHYSVDFVQDHQGWWQGRCNCGLDLGVFPDPEDVCDALMDHAYRAGYESRSYLPLPPDDLEASNPASGRDVGHRPSPPGTNITGDGTGETLPPIVEVGEQPLRTSNPASRLPSPERASANDVGVEDAEGVPPGAVPDPASTPKESA